MDHRDHVALIAKGVPTPAGTWADLGSGSGAFTLALADLMGSTGRIYSVDRDRGALQEQQRRMGRRFPDVTVEYVVADFTGPLDLPLLDGIIMANSLHFQRRKKPLLDSLHGLLRAGGRFILVEYNTDRGNRWVPHPISYPTWERLARRSGFVDTELLATVPSSFLGEIYSALSRAPVAQD